MGRGGEMTNEQPPAPAAGAAEKPASPAATKRAAVGRPRAPALLASLLLWPGIVAFPLVLQHRYAALWPEAWYAYPPAHGATPSPLGLTLGLVAVAVGMVFVLAYQYLRFHGVAPFDRTPVSVQVSGQRDSAHHEYHFWEGVATHLSNPEGFVLLGGYLAGTWLLGLMPASYYSFEGGIQWPLVLAQLLMQDFVQYLMHFAEHKVSPAVYQASHKPHHRFTNPRLFDAFNGSVTDTVLMILVPLYTTAVCVRGVNVWSYMAFGSLYANWLTLIHSEWPHAWDPVFRRLGFGTAADHHVHHKLFTKNYGHLFMYWDYAGGTYRDPASIALFNKGV